MIPAIALLERRVFGEIQKRFWLENGLRLICAGAATGLVQIALRNVFADNWLTLGLEFAVGGAVYCLVLFVTGFVDNDERELINSVRARMGLI